MSPNQLSGTGDWISPRVGMTNEVVEALGVRQSHPYQPMLPPLIVLSDGTIALTVTMAIKPVYGMDTSPELHWVGQTLQRLHLLTIPNGLLLSHGPAYLDSFPGLLFPGKDDATVPLVRKRARISMDRLSAIASWRHILVWPTKD